MYIGDTVAVQPRECRIFNLSKSVEYELNGRGIVRFRYNQCAVSVSPCRIKKKWNNFI